MAVKIEATNGIAQYRLAIRFQTITDVTLVSNEEHRDKVHHVIYQVQHISIWIALKWNTRNASTFFHEYFVNT